jgi:LruC domain-containing protein
MPDGEVIKTIDNLTIPEGFDWKTVKDLSVTVNVTSGQTGNGIHIIKIYNSSLLTGGSLIATGAASVGSPFSIQLTVATPTQTLYITDTRPDGIVKTSTLEVTSANLVATLNADSGMIANAADLSALNRANASFTSPDITVPSNYDVTINSNSASITLTGFNSGESSAYGNTYKSYLIPSGFTRTQSIDFGNWLTHSVLYVQGTLNLNSSPNLNKCSIVILNGGNVTVRGISNGGDYSSNPPVIVVKAGGTLTFTSDAAFSNSAVVVNKGTMHGAGNNITLNINSSSKIYNEGTINLDGNKGKISVTNSSQAFNSGTVNAIDGNLTVNATFLNDTGATINVGTWYQSNGTILNNYGEISATVQFGNSGGGTINNFCRIAALLTDVQSVTLNLESGSLLNTGTFKVNNSTIVMAAQSMFLTGDITSIYGMALSSNSSTTKALFKCTGNIPDMRWANSTVKGLIEFVHEKLTTGTGTNGQDLYSSSFSNNAVLTKTQTVNITGTSCNGSLGQIEPNAGGGSTETEFLSYFPSQTGWATYAFEDQWPIKGDYDLNDIVLGFRVTWVSNSSNQVTEMRVDYKLLAVGAIKTLSAGFQLDNVNASNIQSVTGQIAGSGSPFVIASNGTEQGVTKAVIPVFNDAKNVVSYSGFLNTVEGTFTPVTEKQIVVKFVSPVAQSSLTISSFNFFIVPDERGKEIHLSGYAPTSKFNTAFATGASLYSGDYFKYADGMMWGLMFPENFNYPQETKSIVSAYNHFAAWATSGGTNYSDWYQDKSGYRNTDKIY